MLSNYDLILQNNQKQKLRISNMNGRIPGEKEEIFLNNIEDLVEITPNLYYSVFLNDEILLNKDKLQKLSQSDIILLRDFLDSNFANRTYSVGNVNSESFLSATGGCAYLQDHSIEVLLKEVPK